MSTRRPIGFAVAGVVWGLIAYLLGRQAVGPALLGGVLASPLIGVVVGIAVQERFETSALGKRVLLALASLYLGAILFGLSLGTYDWVRGSSGRGFEVVLEGMVAVVYGTTLFLIGLWPLAYISHLAFATNIRWWQRP
jgi:hypothetical protein